jgi:SAM-dependent methyltransferase
MSDISVANAGFWNELCGSQAARALGIADASVAALARFDRWYFEFYPYLERHIPFGALAGRRVLDVGLGYGTVSQRLAECGALYHGLDIAANPVELVRHRLRQCAVAGEVTQGSILDCPWPDGYFDHVVAIGCYHHTGDLRRALAQTHRVLRGGGAANLMVYSAYSYRRWLRWPGATARRLIAERRGREVPAASLAERLAYDAAASGGAAPETSFVSARALREMMRDWSRVSIVRENIGSESILAAMPRGWLLAGLGPWCGLDLYCSAVK